MFFDTYLNCVERDSVEPADALGRRHELLVVDDVHDGEADRARNGIAAERGEVAAQLVRNGFGANYGPDGITVPQGLSDLKGRKTRREMVSRKKRIP